MRRRQRRRKPSGSVSSGLTPLSAAASPAWTGMTSSRSAGVARRGPSFVRLRLRRARPPRAARTAARGRPDASAAPRPRRRSRSPRPSPARPESGACAGSTARPTRTRARRGACAPRRACGGRRGRRLRADRASCGSRRRCRGCVRSRSRCRGSAPPWRPCGWAARRGSRAPLRGLARPVPRPRRTTPPAAGTGSRPSRTR